VLSARRRALPLRLPQAVYEGMIAHAAQAHPAEAVGLLGGRGHEVDRHVPLPNVLGGRRFLADPYAQFRALRLLAAEELEPVAVYHSHPDGGVTLSATDLLFARRLPFVQVVIAIGRPFNPAPRVAAYTVTDAGVEPVELELMNVWGTGDDDKARHGHIGRGARGQPRDGRREGSR
jgi:proteasome lid subunit RPN8/RPN11